MFEQVNINSERWFDLKDLKNEIWKNINDYENSYLISNYGRIKSLERKIKHKTYKEKIMKLEESKDGYLRVDLYLSGKRKHKKVHRLVAESFLIDYYDKCCVNHIDENKHNNLINNLEICDYSYNINYGTRNQKVADKLSKKINQYTLDGEFIKTWKSMSEIKRKTGINISSISSCCKNKTKKVNDYIFRYY